jgi:large conductance mechanosensitive channel
MLNEFKTFILRGNLVDLAVGFTVGAAFTTVARSLVDDVIMPVVGLVLGRVDFENFFVVLDPGDGTLPFRTLEQAQQAGAVTLNYGVLVNNLVTLTIVGVVMFLLIRFVNRLQDQLPDDQGGDDHAPEEPDNKKCVYCRSTIPYRATRCPQCTSQLSRAEDAQPATAG